MLNFEFENSNSSANLLIVLRTADSDVKQSVLTHFKLRGFKVYFAQFDTQYWVNVVKRAEALGIQIVSISHTISDNLTSQNVTHHALSKGNADTSVATKLH
jgi:hypothetical protein